MPTLAEMRAKLAGLNARTSKKQNDIWKAKDEHDLHLLPDPDGGDPMPVRVFHYELGGQSCLCPKANFGKKCVVCDFCDVLRSWKDPKTGQDKPEAERKADFEIFKKIQPNEKAYVRVIERMKDGTLSPEGPKWWSPGFTNNNKILDICGNTDRQAAVGTTEEDGLRVLFDAHKAYELHISLKKKNNEDKKGNKKNRDATEITDVSVGPKALAKSKADVEKILKSCKNLNEVFPEQTPEEVKAIFDKFVGQGSAESKPEGGTEKYAANTTENAGVKGGKSIDEAFEGLVD